MIYRTILNINFNHAYFLNKGNDEFSGLPEKEQINILRSYNVADYLEVMPTLATEHTIKGYRLLFKPHPQGFRIVSQVIADETDPLKYTPLVELPDDLTLTFGLYSTDPYFENYTHIITKGSNRLYLFSNQKPDSEPSDFANIFTADGSVDPDFLLTEEGARQIVHTIVSEDEFFNSNHNRFSIAHIDKVDSGTPDNIVLFENYIQSQKNNGLIGFVRLTVKGDNNHDLLEFDASDSANIKQYVQSPSLQFTLGFKNRRTFWRYIGDFEGTPLVTADTKPLVKNGFIPIGASDFNPEPEVEHHFPNPKVKLIKKEESNYYSDIFI